MRSPERPVERSGGTARAPHRNIEWSSICKDHDVFFAGNNGTASVVDGLKGPHTVFLYVFGGSSQVLASMY